MAFELYNWSEVSVSLNQGIISADMAPGSSPVQQGSMNIFSYFSPTDNIATISANGYFIPQVLSLCLYDLIFVTGSDYSTILQITSITYPDGQSTAAVVNVTPWLPSSLVEYSTTTALTTAQIKGMYTTPVLLVPNQGANTLIIVDSYVIDQHFLTAQYTAGGLITAQYGNTTEAGGVIATTGIAAASLLALTAQGALTDTAIPTGGLNTAVANTGIYLSNATEAFASGAGAATVTTYYRVLTLV